MPNVERIYLPRVAVAAAGSGQGKTMVTCALLRLLSDRGEDVRAFKCGPDYIDPMFHRRVLAVPSYNLDGFFSDGNTLRYLLASHGKGGFAVIEGVMGYYDGLGGVSLRASTYEIAKETRTPVLLLVNASGSSLSALAVLKGFLSFQRKSGIAGVIFNRLAPSLYPGLKNRVETEFHIPVAGYIPKLSGVSWDSRHLGLIKPGEIPEFQKQISTLAGQVEKTVDMDVIVKLAGEAGELAYRPVAIPAVVKPGERKVKIAVAMDEAFCFYYQDNLELLERMGAELKYFSPLRDAAIPGDAAGLYLGGGYPELYAAALSENASMLRSVRRALANGMPCIAECGGYLYLKEKLVDTAGNGWPMAGFLPGCGFPAGKLVRFGYAALTAGRPAMVGKEGEPFPVHEFHYWDCVENGDSYTAKKPSTGRAWSCGYGAKNLYAGFPHLYFYSAPPDLFLRNAAAWRDRTPEGGERDE